MVSYRKRAFSLKFSFKASKNLFAVRTKQSKRMAGVVVVFDFDKTIIDCDSDNWVIDALGFTNLFDAFLQTMPWNTAMDRMMNELHSHGKTIEDIAQTLKTAPLHSNVISTIKAAHALGCDLRILSDANLFFIETILKHHGLMNYFSEINTNPSYIEGRLRISPHHDFTTTPHGCACNGLCPPNMCKGLVIERIRASVGGGKRFIYLGDGKGDFCPSTKLRQEDFVMPRKNYPVWELMCDNPLLIKAEIHEWGSWEEQEDILLGLVYKIITDADSTSSLIASDCRFETIPIVVQKPLRQAA